MSVLEVHGVAESFTVGGLDVAVVRKVVLWKSIEVPTINGVECPGSACISFLVDFGIAAHGCQRHFVVVKKTIEVSIGQNRRSCIGLT